jgi:hypothetical protein
MRSSGSISPPFLTQALDGSEWSASRHWHSAPKKGGKLIFMPGIEPQPSIYSPSLHGRGSVHICEPTLQNKHTPKLNKFDHRFPSFCMYWELVGKYISTYSIFLVLSSYFLQLTCRPTSMRQFFSHCRKRSATDIHFLTTKEFLFSFWSNIRPQQETLLKLLT